jgi:hypothetical protein
MSRFFKFALAWCVLATISALAYAAASGRTNSLSPAGEGAARISGWTVSDIQYYLGSDPSKIEAISFSLDRSAGTVLVKLAAADSQYFGCEPASGNRWHCDIAPGLDVSRADELRVVATGN